MSVRVQVRAVVTNDTQALGSDGKPLLSLDECWRLGASNETLRRALTEALHWLDTTADGEAGGEGKGEGGGEGEGGAQWRRLLRLANLTQVEVDSGLRDPADGNAPLLGSAFVEVRVRVRVMVRVRVRVRVSLSLSLTLTLTRCRRAAAARRARSSPSTS